jgi:hypothetical protein
MIAPGFKFTITVAAPPGMIRVRVRRHAASGMAFEVSESFQEAKKEWYAVISGLLFFSSRKLQKLGLERHTVGGLSST